MNAWTNITALAKSALSTAQQRIDKVLDIHEEQEEDGLVPGSNFSDVIRPRDFCSGDNLLSFDSSLVESGGASAGGFEEVSFEQLSSNERRSRSSTGDVIRVTDEASCSAAFPATTIESNSTVVSDASCTATLLAPKHTFSVVLEKDYWNDGEAETCDSEESSSATLVGSIVTNLAGSGESNSSSFAAVDRRSSSNLLPLTLVAATREEQLNRSDVVLAARQCVHDVLDLLEDMGESLSPADSCYVHLQAPGDGETIGQTSLPNQPESSKGSSPNRSKTSETLSSHKESESASPCDEGETTTSSDVEIISFSVDDNCSDHSSKSSLPHAYEITNPAIFNKVLEGRFAGFSEGFAGVCQDASRRVVRSPSANNVTSELDKDGYLVKQQLEKREKSLMEIVTQNSLLVAENEELKRRVQEVLQELNSCGTCSTSSRTDDELQRTCDALSVQNREYKRKLEKLQGEFRIGVQQLRQLLSQKEVQVQQLLVEGEELSKRELKQSTVIKKLREKERESARTMEKLEAKLKAAEDLKRALAEKVNEIAGKDKTIAELQSKVSGHESTTARLKDKLNEAEGECDRLREQSVSFAERIADLSRGNVEKQEQIAALEAASEEAKQADLRRRLDELQAEYDSQKRILDKKIEQLQENEKAARESAFRRQEILKAEVDQLQKKLQAAEWRNQEVADGVVEATRPLMKEIESLKTFYRNRQANWEQSERVLYDRLREAEKKVTDAQQTERETQKSYQLCCIRQKELEVSLSKLTAEKNEVDCLLSSVRHDLQLALQSEERALSSLDAERKHHAEVMAEMRQNREKKVSDSEFSSDLKALRLLECTVEELKKELAKKDELIADLQAREASSLLNVREIPTERVKNRESLDLGGIPFILEQLRERLQMKEREFSAINEEYKRVLMARDALSAEVTKLNSELQEKRSAVAELSQLKQSFQDLNNKHQALLQLYGEKIEETEELRMDLQDLKDIYHSQIEEIVRGRIAS